MTQNNQQKIEATETLLTTIWLGATLLTSCFTVFIYKCSQKVVKTPCSVQMHFCQLPKGHHGAQLIAVVNVNLALVTLH